MKTLVHTACLRALVVLLATLSTQSLHASASLSLNGANQYVQVPANTNFTPANLTFEAWVYPTAQKCNTILSRGDGGLNNLTDYIFDVGYDGTNCGTMTVGFMAAGAWDASSTTVSLNTWTHVAVTYDGTQKRFYINGVLDRTAVATNPLYSTTNSPLYIGRQGLVCDCNFFNGQLAEVRLWNTVRTASQIQSDMNFSSGAQPGLVAYYHLNEGSGTNAFDASTNGNTGTLEGGASWSSLAPPLDQWLATNSTGTTGSGQSFPSLKPTQFLHYIMAYQGIYPSSGGGGPLTSVDRTSPYLGEIKAVAFTAIPTGYFECAGQTLSISSYAALYSILGTTYGGNGSTTFALPNLTGSVPIGFGSGFGLPIYNLGQSVGAPYLPLNITTLPAHTHTLPGGGNTGSTGGGLPMATLQPSLAINFIIDSAGEIAMFAGNFAPTGWAVCDGSLLPISSYPTLYNSIGTTFGGDGVSTFALPDLQGRSPVGLGGSPAVTLGGQYGAATVTLSQQNLPSHNHSIPGGTTGNTGSSLPCDIRQPVLGINWAIAQNGLYPGNASPFLGEMRLFAGAVPSGTTWVQANGQFLSISANSALFSILGTSFGGDGLRTFALPNLDGNMGASQGNGYYLGEFTGTPTLTLTATYLTPHTHALPFAPTLTGALRQTNGAFQFSFTNIPNNSFTVLTATNLAIPGSLWTAIATITNTSPGQYQFTSTPTNDPERFYQIRLP